MKVAEEKVPGGKLVRLAVARDGCVTITGDFFLHPEESITLIEDALGRLDSGLPVREIEQLLDRIIAEGDIELIGVDVPAIVRLYRRCQTCGE